MNELQSKLVDMLEWYHGFCKKNGLRYYIVAGTMLGALRHGGFIPWDDDIDVGMPRSDYEKLRRLCENQKTGKYMFEFPGENNKEYPFLWAKLFDTETTIIEKQRDRVTRGIYLDVFPLDGIGSTQEEAEKNFQPIKKSMNLNAAVSFVPLKRRKWYKNLAVVAGHIISPLFVNRHKLRNKIDALCQKYDYDSCEFVGSLMGGYNEKDIVRREYFGNPVEIDFEHIKTYGLENPDPYLKHLYGDYMKLPPEEKRISYHDLDYCDLNKGYLNNNGSAKGNRKI